MKKIVIFVSLAVLYVSCQKKDSQSIEPGIYEAYQQGFSEIVTVTKASHTGNEDIVVVKSMEEGVKFPSIFDGIDIIEGKPISDLFGGSIILVDVSKQYELPLEYTLVVETNGKSVLTIQNNSISTIEYNISRNGDQLCFSLSIKNGQIVRFSPKFLRSFGNFPIGDESLIVTSKDKDYRKYVTLQGEIQGESIILYFYDARISNGRTYVSQSNINYLDIDRIRTEMNETDVLEFVKKAIYFKKKE